MYLTTMIITVPDYKRPEYEIEHYRATSPDDALNWVQNKTNELLMDSDFPYKNYDNFCEEWYYDSYMGNEPITAFYCENGFPQYIDMEEVIDNLLSIENSLEL